jgi:CRP/FNR family transcriptional regulator, cyclic AMP receptor protein
MATMMIQPAANRVVYPPPLGPQTLGTRAHEPRAGATYAAPVGLQAHGHVDDVANKLLAGQSAFGRLPERDLLELVQRSTVRTLREREYVFRRGDPGRTVYAVLAGYVKLSSLTAGGREVVLEIVRPGGCFGELAVLNGTPRAADATAISRCRLLAVDGRQFTQVMGRSLEGLQAMVKLISRRLRATTQRVLDSVALPATARLAKALLHLAELQCTTVRDGARIDLPMSQSELGGMTGLTRESVNKALAVLRDAGWISQSGDSVTLLDIAALDSVAGEE